MVKKLLLSTLFLLPLSSFLRADVVGTGGTGGGGAPTYPLAGPAADNCAAPPFSFTDDADTGACSPVADTFAIRTGGTSRALFSLAVANDNTTNFLDITGTMPTTPTAEVHGVEFNFTSAGSASFVNEGIQLNYNTGYTGASGTTGLEVLNPTRSTSAWGPGSGRMAGSNPSGNIAIVGYADGFLGAPTGVGDFVGVYGVGGGQNNASSIGVGVAGHARSSVSSGGGIGVLGSASVSEGSGVGGMFVLSTTASSATTSAALIVDNVAVAAPIAIFRDNGTATNSIENSGALWNRVGNKALTLGGGAVAFVRYAIAQESFAGGQVRWCATASDGSAEQIRCGMIPFTAVNSAGTEVCTIGTPTSATESVAVSTGTFTVAFTSASGAADTCDISANGTASITESAMSINYTLEFNNAAPVAVTPQ